MRNNFDPSKLEYPDAVHNLNIKFNMEEEATFIIFVTEHKYFAF